MANLSIGASTRTFNGSIYVLRSKFLNKNIAQKNAKALRNRKISARITDEQGHYCVWQKIS